MRHTFRRQLGISRLLHRVVWLACSLPIVAAFTFGQITNVTNDQSTPIPGAGHDYIHMLIETVNPANGSVSLRIQVAVKKDRGLTSGEITIPANPGGCQ